MASKSTAPSTTGPDPAVIAALKAALGDDSQAAIESYMSGFATSSEPAVKSAKSATGAKVAKVRNLDSETLPFTITGSDGRDHEYNVVVVPTQGNGKLWRPGSRIQVKGAANMALRSLDAGALSVLVENHDMITAAMATVDERAMLGAFLPKDEQPVAAKS